MKIEDFYLERESYRQFATDYFEQAEATNHWYFKIKESEMPIKEIAELFLDRYTEILETYCQTKDNDYFLFERSVLDGLKAHFFFPAYYDQSEQK